MPTKITWFDTNNSSHSLQSCEDGKRIGKRREYWGTSFCLLVTTWSGRKVPRRSPYTSSLTKSNRSFWESCVVLAGFKDVEGIARKRRREGKKNLRVPGRPTRIPGGTRVPARRQLSRGIRLISSSTPVALRSFYFETSILYITRRTPAPHQKNA